MSKHDKTNGKMIGPRINLQPMAGQVTAESIKNRLLELQLRMATSSINHEYARIEFDDTDDHHRREELLDFMNDCHAQYLDARSQLQIHNPSALEEFEADLIRQKQAAISQYSA